jgi:CsoR family transcriptional regulator, copper-sensing transcriptional repressor
MARATKSSGTVATRKAKKRVAHVKPAHDCETLKVGADHSAQINRLNRIVGQLQGIGRMIEGKRYCPEILLQTHAVISAIRSLEGGILEEHLRHCVKLAFTAKDKAESEQVIQELIDLYSAQN